MLAQTCYPASIVLTAQISDKKHLRPIRRWTASFIGSMRVKIERCFRYFGPSRKEGSKDGAIARILLREFWSKGTAPTFAAFAAAWLQAVEDHPWPNSEWAFLANRAQGLETSEWKALRAKKAAAALELLQKIAEEYRIR